MNVVITIPGLDKVMQRVDDLGRRARDLSPVMRVAASDFLTMTDDAFRQETSPMGEPWAPLKPSTIRGRKGAWKILQDTGRLRASIDAKASSSGFKFGTKVVYAPVHQFGSVGGSAVIGGIPRRSFLPVTVTGAWDPRGPAGAFINRVTAAILQYVSTGSL